MWKNVIFTFNERETKINSKCIFMRLYSVMFFTNKIVNIRFPGFNSITDDYGLMYFHVMCFLLGYFLFLF